ncbi:MAG TPA: hypothetical protein VMW35_03010 [Myxococcota bacterium]|nr:hypothetical protein [Myxococcota bacterium]
MRLTLFTTCKPFRGEFARIQSDALESWTRLDPRPEILVIGDAPGVDEACARLGLRRVPDVPSNEFGTPLLDGLVAAAERAASGELLAFVNADVLLPASPLAAAERVAERFARFLLVARRWNVPLAEPWDFSAPDWAARLEAFALARGRLEPVYGGVDLFVFPRGLFASLPAFAIGRGRWDSALVYHARAARVPVVDATASLVTVHPDHGYGHHPGDRSGVFQGPEAVRNEALLGGAEYVFSAANATHVLDARGLRRPRRLDPVLALRRLANLPALHPSLGLLVPLVRAAAPLWRARRGTAGQP